MTIHTSSIAIQHLLAVAVQAAVLAILVGGVAFVFRRQLSPRWRHRLWWIVVIRLAIPVLPTSPVSVYQWLPEPIAANQEPPNTKHASPATTVSPTPHHNASIPPVGDESGELSSSSASITASPIPADPIAGALLTPELVQPTTPTISDTGTAQAMPPHAHQPHGTATDTPAKAHTAWWWPIAFIVWLGVAAVLAMRTILGWLMLGRRVRSDSSAASERATALLQHEADTLGMNSPPKLLESFCIPGPTLHGVFRPILLMPQGLAQSLDDRALRLIFRHELCHLRGRDNLANWLFAFLQAAHWFNPLMWWAFTQLRAQRELARDAQTVQARPAATTGNTQGDYARQYADALFAVVRFTVKQNAAPPISAPSPVTSAAVRDRRHLSRRLAMLEHANRFRLRHTLLACAMISVLGATGLTVAQDRSTRAQEQQEPAQLPQQENAETLPTDQPADGPEQPESDAAQAARQPISALWKAVAFEQVIADLEQQTGLTITFDPTIQDTIDAVDPQPLISLLLARVPIEHALKLALEQLFDQRLHDALPPVGWRWTLEDGTLHLGLETVELGVYVIRDLTTPHQRDMTQAPWTLEEKEAKRLELVEQLRTLIHNTVGDHEHWAGGYAETEYGGTIMEHLGSFIIRTTPMNHREILGLLSWLRAAHGIQISYESQLYLLDNETFIEVFSRDIQVLTSGEEGFRAVHAQRLYSHRFLEHEDGSREPIAGRTPAGFTGLSMISQEQCDALAQRVADSERNDFVLDIPRLTDFNGRQPWAMIAQQLSYISSLESDASTDEIEPTISTTEAGMLLLIEGTVSADRAYVTMRIECEVAAMAGEPLVLPHEGDIDKGFIEIPQIDRATMSSTLSMPKDEWFILIGPLLQGKINNNDDPADYTDTRRVVLLVRPTIIEQQEQEMTAEELEALRERPESTESE